LETIIVTAVWACFSAYLLWFITAVKRNEPITVDEAKTLWRIHKKNTHCTGHSWHPIKRRGGKIKGFKCDCGYKYSQIRPIVAGVPQVSN
jgi:hypothetical protein